MLREELQLLFGSGFNHIYPKENTELYKEIIRNEGVIVSEYPPDEEVSSKNFPKRNKIVSAISDGILIIEGKYRSGTSITAKIGIMQNKPLFCVPHSVYNSYGMVPNELIKKGANLITNSEDIIGFYKNKNIKLKKVEKSREYSNEILQLLSKTSLTKEEIAYILNKNISQINQELTILELEGYIRENIKKEYNIIE